MLGKARVSGNGVKMLNARLVFFGADITDQQFLDSQGPS